MISRSIQPARSCWQQRLFQPLYSARNFCSNKVSDPLRILFCGSDQFSIAALNALHAEHVRDPTTILSIDVVCRPPKRVGSGLKQIREVPIKDAARELSLPVHEIDTFTGWSPPIYPGSPQEVINLIIAVSFGLFVPPRILGAAKYGGLNLHPSLLPDFRGSAPLHHTLLASETQTGITLQTLHPRRFDHGVILAQQPVPIPEPSTITVSALLDLLTPKASHMLVSGVRNRVYSPPLTPVRDWADSSVANDDSSPPRLAPKIVKEDLHINWDYWTWPTIARRQHVLGPLWSRATALPNAGARLSAKVDRGKKEERRVLFDHFSPVITDASAAAPASVAQRLPPGVLYTRDVVDPAAEGGAKPLYVNTVDGATLRVDRIKVAGMNWTAAYIAGTQGKMLQTQGGPDGTVQFFEKLK